MSFWFFILIVVLIVNLPRILGFKRSDRKPKPPALRKITFFGGPMDGNEVEVPDSFGQYHIAPYVPDDESEREQIGEIGGQAIWQTAFAFYNAVGDEGAYFYVRDVSYSEVMELSQHGKIPDTLGE